MVVDCQLAKFFHIFEKLEFWGSEDPDICLVDVAASWHFLFARLLKRATCLECL